MSRLTWSRWNLTSTTKASHWDEGVPRLYFAHYIHRGDMWLRHTKAGHVSHKESQCISQYRTGCVSEFLNSSCHQTIYKLEIFLLNHRNTTLLDPSRGSSFLRVSCVESSNLPFPLSFYYVQQIRIVQENVMRGNTLVPRSKRKMEARRKKLKR